LSEDLGKYREVFDMKRVNALYLEGYSHKETIVETYSDDKTGRIVTKKSYMMSLQEPSKYDDMLAFKKMPITFEEQPVPEGWKGIHHTSKEMILKRVS